MEKKLYKLAIITAPLLSIYGVVPIILFNSIDIKRVLVSALFLTILILFFWTLNIELFKRCQNIFARNSISYLGSLLFNTLIYFVVINSSNPESNYNILVYSTVATILINTTILLVINIVYANIKRESIESENQKLKISNLEAQKQALIRQIQPHFLFNALSTLKALIKSNPSDAEDYTVSLSEFLRYSIQSPTNEFVCLIDEIQFTKDYFELQKFRFGSSIKLVLDIPESYQKLKVPVFSLQLLVENAIKHNSFTEQKPLFIEISFESDRIKVKNNKSPKILIHKSGTGLKNLVERYKLVLGMSKSIEIVDSDESFIVYLYAFNL